MGIDDPEGLIILALEVMIHALRPEREMTVVCSVSSATADFHISFACLVVTSLVIGTEVFLLRWYILRINGNDYIIENQRMPHVANLVVDLFRKAPIIEIPRNMVSCLDTMDTFIQRLGDARLSNIFRCQIPCIISRRSFCLGFLKPFPLTPENLDICEATLS